MEHSDRSVAALRAYDGLSRKDRPRLHLEVMLDTIRHARELGCGFAPGASCVQKYSQARTFFKRLRQEHDAAHGGACACDFTPKVTR